MTQRRTIGNVPMFELNNLLSSDNNLTPNKSKKSGRKRGKGKNWIKVREFEDGRDADCIRKGEDWAYFYRGKCNDGEYIIMRCW